MRLKELAADRSAAGLPDLSLIVLAEDDAAVAAGEQVRRVVARQYLVRLLRAVRALREDRPDAPEVARALELLDAWDVDEALDRALSPDMTGWIWRSTRPGTDPETLLTQLGRCLGPERPGATAHVGLGARRPAAPVVTTAAGIRSAQLFGWAGEGDEVPLDLTPERAREFAATVQRGADALAAVWPEGREMAAIDIQAFAALGGHRGLRPLNFSVHGLRGLVLTSERPAYMLAQTLVHEATHQRFSGILDCVAVVRNPEARHHSPFVDAERPLGHIAHGILSFINDVHVAGRHLGTERDPAERARIQRYLALKTDQLRVAEKNLLEVAEPTEHGARLLAGCRSAIDRLDRG
ncbi:HEXXH motif-containing putative peptide modification protein [Streptomyces sp. NPDC005706]|uniref:aKG-HExxH-type peptide beta-hydroxylase n=1 Tax=Streptomyces sp. NPDC005706 TaxID=3157169 RepID=UPI003406DFED